MIAVIPAAGLGTRLLPLTKSIPKELLPVGERPAIQWVLRELREAFITRIVVVESSRKPALHDFLTHKGGTDSRSSERQKELDQLLQSLQISFVEQPEPCGLKDAVWQCRSVVGSEPFALVMPDNVSANAELLRRLLHTQATTGHSCVAVYPQSQNSKHLRTARFVFETTRSDDGVSRIVGVVPLADLIPDTNRAWRIGIGRTIFAGSSMELFAPRESTPGKLDDCEFSALNALVERDSLLGVEASEQIWHIGSMEIYKAAFKHFAASVS
jgi:UTP--glucose-1-phosphate uridylyltransferase